MRCLCAMGTLILGVGAMLPGLAHDGNSCVATDEPGAAVCHHFFERTTVDLPVRNELDSIDGVCERLVIRVMQRQGVLLAQLQEPLDFDEEECAALTSIALQLPDVRSETDIVVQLSQADSAAGQDPQISEIAVRVYPDTLLEPLARLAEQRPLVVLGDDDVFTGFLDRNEIAYVRHLPRFSEKPIALLIQPDEPERILEDRSIETAVIFREKIVDLPQVRATSTGGQTRVYVELRLLHDLRGNPLAQKALLKIINLAINPNQIDRG